MYSNSAVVIHSSPVSAHRVISANTSVDYYITPVLLTIGRITKMVNASPRNKNATPYLPTVTSSIVRLKKHLLFIWLFFQALCLMWLIFTK